MTTEQRTLISPADIVGIEYTCPTCKGRCMATIEKFANVPYQCPNCKNALIEASRADATKPSDEQRINSFVHVLRDLQDAKVAIRLEIATSSSVPVFGGKG